MDTRYINSMKYYDFLIETASNNEKVLGLANTIVAVIEDKPLSEITHINEGVTDKIKNLWEKLKLFVKKLWAKFLEYFNRVILKNEEWLEKYKDIITKVKPNDTEIEMRKYFVGIDNIMKTQIPPFRSVQDKVPTSMDTNAPFVNTIIANYTQDKELDSYAVVYYEGGQEDRDKIKMSELPMGKIYEYCHDFNKINTAIEKDVKAIEDSLSDIETKLSTAIKDSETAPAATPAPTANPEKKIGDAFYYDGNGSVIYESISKKERDSIPDNQFGLEKEHKYPMRNAKEVRAAIHLFGKCNDADKSRLAKRIIKFAKKYNVPIDKNSKIYKYAHNAKNECVYTYYEDFFLELEGEDGKIDYIVVDGKKYDINGDPVIDDKAGSPITDNEAKTRALNAYNSKHNPDQGTAPKKVDNKQADHGSSGISINNKSTGMAANASSVGKDADANKAITLPGNKQDTAAFEELKNKATTYKDTTLTILKAELTASHQMYDDFMKILRTHVHDHVGADNKEGTASTGGDNSQNITLDNDDVTDIRSAIDSFDKAGDQAAKNKISQDLLKKIKGKYPTFNGTAEELMTAVKTHENQKTKSP